MNKKELSIIVPVYNVAKFLPQCLDSICRQKNVDLEIIVVDDGSTDESLKICEEYEKKDEKIQVFHKTNGGLISAKKEGLLHAKGKYIGFVDGDDWVDDTMYEQLVNAAESNQADIAISDNLVEFPKRVLKIKQGISPGVYDKQRLIEEVYPNLAFKEGLYNLGISPSLCTKIFRKELLMTYQFAVNEMIQGGEDAACTYPCILQADKMVYVGDCYSYHYRIHEKSMTHKKTGFNVDERIVLLNHLYDCFAAYDYPKLERQLALYASSVVETMVYIFVKNGCYRDEDRINELTKKVTGSAVWQNILELSKKERLPKTTINAIRYLMYPTKSNLLKIFRRVKVVSFKRYLRKVLV